MRQKQKTAKATKYLAPFSSLHFQWGQRFLSSIRWSICDDVMCKTIPVWMRMGILQKKNGGQIGWQDNRSQVQRHGWGGWCKLHNTTPTPKKYCELISTPSSLFCNILGRKWWCIQPQSCCIGLESRKPSMLTRLRVVLDFVFTCQHSNTLPSKRFFLALWFLSHGVSVFRPELDTRLPTQERIPGPHSWQQANVLTPSNYFFSQKEGFITPPKAR